MPLAQLAWTENAQQQAQSEQAPVYAQRTGTYGATHDEILGGLDQALAGVDGYKANDSAHIEYQNNSGKQPPTLTTAYLTSTKTNAKTHPPATINYYHCDQIGTPRELTDELGAVTWRATYKAWGRVEKEQSYAGLSLASGDGEVTSDFAHAQVKGPNQASQTHQPLRFQGQYYDEETGLHYNRFRYYEPDSGRYVSSDPIKLLGGLNVHQYAPNSTRWVDPFGLAAGGGGVYIFETRSGSAYIGKGPYDRYVNGSVRQRAGGAAGVDRGVHMDTKSPCTNVSEAEYAEIVEHRAMLLYALTPGSKPLLNDNTSPGAKRINPNIPKGSANLAKCPKLQTSAMTDAAALVLKLQAKPVGSGI